MAVFGCCSLLRAQEGAKPWIEMGKGVPNFVRKVQNKKQAHVAFLGGSITQNKSGHSAMVPTWLKQTYPDCEFSFTNAGLSSTCSTTGAFRLRDHLLSKGAIDLLILEFAVNDDQDGMHDRQQAIRGLEGIIRAFKQANPVGDVISVQYVNPAILEKHQKGEEAVSVKAHKDVARHYQLPIVDVGLALAGAIEKGESSWEIYGGTHPKPAGYQFATSLITSVIKQTKATASQVTNEPLPEPIDPGNYELGTFLDPQVASWLGGWKFDQVGKELLPIGGIRSDYEVYKALRSDEAGSMLYLSFKGDMLGAFVLAGPDAGQLEVSINDGEWKTVDLYHHYSKGLNYPRSVILAEDIGRSFNQAAIRVSKEKNPASKGHAATILFFEVNSE